ncbi:peptide ligase PGM1-related protein [Cellulomonas endophytica]|uniref:peptide ligase PGM1-related protein n=1 Tax=Cellulomonas endophytica TaxID=2494735 RepID=UPI001013717F|nr:peptide ligase PGM1-related protein [Cellulomonas endophytica]
MIGPGELAARFHAVQERLPAALGAASQGATVTVVVVPSLSSEPDLVRREPVLRYWEHRMLYLLGALRDETVHLVVVTSRAVSPAAAAYALDVHAHGVGGAGTRLSVLTCAEEDGELLTQRLLRRPDLLARIRSACAATRHAYIECFAATEPECRLAIELGLPLNAADPALAGPGRKSGGRRLMRELGIPVPTGIEGVRGVEALARALADLKGRDPALEQAVVKLESSVGGVGNAVFRYAGVEAASTDALVAGLAERLELAVPVLGLPTFLRRVADEGCVVEHLVDGPGLRSPSVQCTIGPDGRVAIEGTHDQVLTGVLGQHFGGCWFPAADATVIHAAAAAVGRRLSALGVIGWFGLDLLTSDGPGGRRPCGIEINLRSSGTVHHLRTLRDLVGGTYDEVSGEHLAEDGAPRAYYGTDGVVVPGLVGMEAVDLVRACGGAPWAFRRSSGTGVVLHMLDAVTAHGRLGLTCIGRTRTHAAALLDAAVSDLALLAGRRDEGVPRTGEPGPAQAR